MSTCMRSALHAVAECQQCEAEKHGSGQPQQGLDEFAPSGQLDVIVGERDRSPERVEQACQVRGRLRWCAESDQAEGNACTARDTDLATVIRVIPPGARSALTLRAPSQRIMDYCGRDAVGSAVDIRPVEPDIAAGFAHQ